MERVLRRLESQKQFSSDLFHNANGGELVIPLSLIPPISALLCTYYVVCSMEAATSRFMLQPAENPGTFRDATFTARPPLVQL